MSLGHEDVVVFSDSSDDIGVLSDYVKRISERTAKDAQAVQSSAAEDDSEPDWVRDFEPKKETDREQKEAFLASLDDDDDDSVIDLISQEPRLKAQEQLESQEPSQSQSQKDGSQSIGSTKRARGPTKLKSKLPLVVAPKLDENLVLLQSVDTDLDLSGDVGAVGRVKVQDGDLFLDIKGVVYRTGMYPCNTMCVVNVVEDEARITAVMDEAVTLTCERNLFASDEVVVQGDVDMDMADDSQFDADDEGLKSIRASGKESNAKSAKKRNTSKAKSGKPTKAITKSNARKR